METPGMIKTRLLLKKAEIEARFGRAHAHLFAAREVPASTELMEHAGQFENGEVIYSLEQEALAELVKIKRALQRLEEGHYTKCSRCSLPITERRLKAFPATDLCFNCSSHS